MIEPRTLKGFRDFLPEMMIPREILIDRVSSVYRSYGFAPIDTPVLEYLEILSGKGSDETDKQLYQFEDNGGRKVGMRFDLTVPFARFSAQHLAELPLPFKRYHLAKVWRGENTQAGRYREFMQCDFDTIGTTSSFSDVETALVINDIMERIDLKTNNSFTRFQIHLNSRKILTGLLEKLDIPDKAVPVLRALDKLGKIGREKVAEEMIAAAGIPSDKANSILDLVLLENSDNESVLNHLEKTLSGNENGLDGVSVLRQILDAASSLGIPKDRFVLDISIARGLDYYTGTIFETFLTDLPKIGSVCSGGRYDNLAGLYTKQTLPGIGASLGMDRLFAALEELGMVEKTSSPVQVLIACFDKNLTNEYLKIGSDLRKIGIGAEIYPEPKKLGIQLKFADRKGFACVLVIGSSEWERKIVQVKNLKTGSQDEVSITDLPDYLKKVL
ncbi:MAG: histidine--tRNA ligase [Planctomycetia bacterium]|nr:histidine--tRNA ligase [Planctomycetia bacterium]